MRRVLLIAAVLALAGCGGGGAERDASADPALPAVTTSASPTTAAAPEPERSSRGSLVKALGQEGGFCSDADCAGPYLVTFTVDSITADPPCTADYVQPPENGHFVAVALRVATSAEFDPAEFPLSFSPSDFRVIGADGITQSNLASAASFSCLDQSEMFPQDILGTGQQYTGTILLDSPTPSGVLIYAPPFSSTGWEWQF